MTTCVCVCVEAVFHSGRAGRVRVEPVSQSVERRDEAFQLDASDRYEKKPVRFSVN